MSNPYNRQHEPIFFTYPVQLQYPWILGTVSKARYGKFRRANALGKLLDLGIYQTEGDGRYPKRMVQKLWEAAENGPRNWIVACPDYLPYNPQTGEVVYENVHKTLEMWDKWEGNLGRDRCIFTVQVGDITPGLMDDDLDCYPQRNYHYIGVGGIAAKNFSRQNQYQVRLFVREVRRRYPNAWIHLWGMGKLHLETIWLYADSWDSNKWNFHRALKRMVKRVEERQMFLDDYLADIRAAFDYYKGLSLVQDLRTLLQEVEQT